jgi:DNA-binding NtrC family response regulator
VTSVDQTLDEIAYSSLGSVTTSPVLFVILEGDRLLARGARYSLVGIETVTIGRGQARFGSRSADGKSLDVRVPGRWISSSHVAIRAVGGEWIAEDTGSRNGTFVNGERITSRVLRDGDIVEAGRVYMCLRGAPAADGPTLRDEDAARSPLPFGLRTLLPELQESHTSLARVAKNSEVPILLLGPTGTGKEVLAREVHAQSGRGGPFIAVNCGALPVTLVEGLLFGHVKGAFSGALRDEIGFVRSAEGGTLFLDEIGDLPATSQAALLRVLQEHEVIPVGATRAVKADVRVVAATHRPLDALAEGAVRRGPGGVEVPGFRNDLLARLRGYTHRLPPLRDRMADLGVILADVLNHVAGPRAPKLTMAPEAARALLAYRWPLNIRELHQAMASAVALVTEESIEPRHLPFELLEAPEPSSTASPPASADADAALRDKIVALLHEHQGNVTAVARAMGKAPAQIHRWMRRLVIDPDVYRPT